MNFQETIGTLSQLSDEELAAELKKQLKIKKDNGSLGEIEKIIRIVEPYLTTEQKQRLAKAIKALQDD